MSEQLKEVIEFEIDQITDRYGDIIDAMAEVEYLINYIRKGTKLTDGELLSAQSTITTPLVLYRQLLEQVNSAAKESNHPTHF